MAISKPQNNLCNHGNPELCATAMDLCASRHANDAFKTQMIRICLLFSNPTKQHNWTGDASSDHVLPGITSSFFFFFSQLFKAKGSTVDQRVGLKFASRFKYESRHPSRQINSVLDTPFLDISSPLPPL